MAKKKSDKYLQNRNGIFYFRKRHNKMPFKRSLLFSVYPRIFDWSLPTISRPLPYSLLTAKAKISPMIPEASFKVWRSAPGLPATLDVNAVRRTGYETA